MPDYIFSKDGYPKKTRDRGTYMTDALDTSPADSAVAVVPSDSTNFTLAARGIYIGVTGDVTAVCGGTAVLFKNCQAGSILPVVCTRVNSTGTTATNLVALI
jgi:hypothetical protein